MKKVLILMPRLSDYMLNCFEEWLEDSEISLHIIHRSMDRSAPYQFSKIFKESYFYEREGLDFDGLEALRNRINPSLIICFGWMDSDYLELVRASSSACKCVMTMDGQWLFTPRQVLALVWARVRLVPFFDFVWVPGERQKRFAGLLGFSKDKIITGLYVANERNFKSIWDNLNGSAPKRRLVFVGRYVSEKGISELCNSFKNYCDVTGSDLELLCFGSGPLEGTLATHPQISHHGFIQPHQFSEKLDGGGIFILPSKFEPWGVVVHEFASAGFPLILSGSVGAADLFLSNDNGRLLRNISDESLRDAFEYVDGLSELRLLEMGRVSQRRAEGLSSKHWVAQAQAFLEWTEF